jgi:hypothetical protein
MSLQVVGTAAARFFASLGEITGLRTSAPPLDWSRLLVKQALRWALTVEFFGNPR